MDQLDEEKKHVLNRLAEKLVYEEEIGGATPMLSILKALADMSPIDVQDCIEAWQAHKLARIQGEADGGALRAKTAESSHREANNGRGKGDGSGTIGDDAETMDAASSWDKSKEPRKWQPKQGKGSNGKEHAEWAEDYSSSPNKTHRGAETVLQECRQQLERAADSTMLLSKLGASLSYEARSYLESKNLKLTRFLGAYPAEFSINSSSDGRESVTNHPGRGGSGWPATKHTKGRGDDTSSTWYRNNEAWNWQEDWWSRPVQVGPKVYVGNLPGDVAHDEVENIFSIYGKVEDVKVMQGRSRRTGQSCAFVVFSRVSEAETCIEAMQDGTVEIRTGEGGLVVKYADDQQSQGYGKDAKENYKEYKDVKGQKDDHIAKGFQ